MMWSAPGRMVCGDLPPETAAALLCSSLRLFQVAVKVQRPDVAESIALDLLILRVVAATVKSTKCGRSPCVRVGCVDMRSQPAAAVMEPLRGSIAFCGLCVGASDGAYPD